MRPLDPREHNDINCNDNLRNFEKSGGNSRGCLMVESKSACFAARMTRIDVHDGVDDDDDDDDDNCDDYIIRSEE